MRQAKIDKILAAHKKWLAAEDGGEQADLSGADLSGAGGLLDPSEFLAKHFEFDDNGLIVFKAFGDTSCKQPDRWDVKPGSVIEEIVNPCRVSTCACGVNCATREWCERFYREEIKHGDVVVWRCRIKWRDLPGVVVPYHTDGKIRCARLELIEPV